MCIFSSSGPLLFSAAQAHPHHFTSPQAAWKPPAAKPTSDSVPHDKEPDTPQPLQPPRQPENETRQPDDHVQKKFAAVMDELINHSPALTAPTPAQSQSSSTVFLFDWDDTIMPTSHLEQCGFMDLNVNNRPATQPDAADVDENPLIGLHNVPEENQADLWMHLARLDRLTVDILYRALKHGRVVIVTNAGLGWVEMSSEKFLPLTARFLAHNKIQVVSARSRYNAAFPDEPCEWKVHAFVDVLYPLDETNVLVFGDSVSDQYAAHRAVLGGRLGGEDRLLKFVKFAERPTADFLRKQLVIAHSNISQLVDHSSSFDVNVAATY